MHWGTRLLGQLSLGQSDDPAKLSDLTVIEGHFYSTLLLIYSTYDIDNSTYDVDDAAHVKGECNDDAVGGRSGREELEEFSLPLDAADEDNLNPFRQGHGGIRVDLHAVVAADGHHGAPGEGA